MDKFKHIMNSKCGVGGLKCFCCNDFRGKDKAKLRRLARRVLKYKLIVRED